MVVCEDVKHQLTKSQQRQTTRSQTTTTPNSLSVARSSNTMHPRHFLAEPSVIPPRSPTPARAPPSVISLDSSPSTPASPRVEVSQQGEGIHPQCTHGKEEPWRCCENVALVAKYEERISTCEVLLQRLHQHLQQNLMAMQIESQSFRTELGAQREQWEKLAQAFNGR